MKKHYMPPDTSLGAHDGVKKRGQKVTHGDLVLQSLSIRKTGNYEEIAMFCNLTPLQVVRRLNELEKAGKIEKTGQQSKTFSGDHGAIYRIAVQVTENKENVQAKLF